MSIYKCQLRIACRKNVVDFYTYNDSFIGMIVALLFKKK